MEFKDKIKKIRRIKKMSRPQLAETIGVSIETLHKYETGYRFPKTSQLTAMGEALQFSSIYLSDISINSDADLFVLLVQIFQQAGLNIEAKKNKDGSLDPETLRFSLKDKSANEKLAAYFSLVEQEKTISKSASKTDTKSVSRERENYEEKLADAYDLLAQTGTVSRTEIRRIMDRPVKSDGVYEMESLLIDCSPGEIDYLIKATKLFKNFNKKNKNQDGG